MKSPSNSTTIIKSITHYIPPIVLFSFYNGLNFFFQSLATGSVSKINSGWYRRSEIGLFGGIFSALLATSYYFTFNIGDALLGSTLDWSFIFIIPGILLIVSGSLTWIIVREKPQQAGWIDINLAPTTSPETPNSNPSSQSPTIESYSLNGANINIKSPPTTIIEQHDEYFSSSEEDDEISLQTLHKSGDLKIRPMPTLISTESININSAILITDNNNNLSEEEDNFRNKEEEKVNIVQQPSSLKISDSTLENGKDKNPIAILKSIIKDVLKKENIAPLLSKDNIFNALALFSIGWVKEGFVSWFLLFITHKYTIGEGPSTFLAICSAGLTCGALIGGFICGALSDLLFKSKRPPAIFIFFIFLNILILLLYFVNVQVLSAIILIGCFIMMFGINNVLAVTAILDLGTQRNAALMAGLLTTFQYFAGGFSGFLLGYIVEHLGFGYWILSMIPFVLFGTVLMGYNSTTEFIFLKKNKFFQRLY
eukprot:gene2751-3419_t